jgi:hypothetical protein
MYTAQGKRPANLKFTIIPNIGYAAAAEILAGAGLQPYASDGHIEPFYDSSSVRRYEFRSFNDLNPIFGSYQEAQHEDIDAELSSRVVHVKLLELVHDMGRRQLKFRFDYQRTQSGNLIDGGIPDSDDETGGGGEEGGV